MSKETIYRQDLENRFSSAGYFVNKTVNGSITRYVLDDDGTQVSYAESPDPTSAILQLREKMGFGIEIPPLLSVTQRNALTGVVQGQPILVNQGAGVHTRQFHDGTGWKTITHT